MKKIIPVLTVLMMVLSMLTPSAAEGKTAEEQDFTGIWTDAGFDKMVLTILPSGATWFDERMGEDADLRKFVIRMNWPSSESEESVYTIVAELDETGRRLAYDGGMFAEYVYDENGDTDEEETCLVEDNGIGSFILTEDGSLRWEDSYLKDAGEMVLRREIAEAPSAEEILESYYRKATDPEAGTAGASLKLAQTVRDIFVFCSVHPFWCMDNEAFSRNLAAAREQLTAEEKAAFDQNRGILIPEINRLLTEDEEAGSVYSDAGVEKQTEELRNSPDIRLSVKTFISAAEALND